MPLTACVMASVLATMRSALLASRDADAMRINSSSGISTSNLNLMSRPACAMRGGIGR